MKKQLLALLAVASMGVAVVGATPQTTFEKGQIQADLGIGDIKAVGQNNFSTGNKINLNAGATYAITDKIAVQYAYTGMKTGNVSSFRDSLDVKRNELNALYSLDQHIAVYAGWSHLSVDGGKSSNFAQAGVIGKMDVAKNLAVYGKVGLGTNKTTLLEAGVGYALTKDLDINAGYRYFNSEVANDYNASFKGFTAGASYRFGGAR